MRSGLMCNPYLLRSCRQTTADVVFCKLRQWKLLDLDFSRQKWKITQLKMSNWKKPRLAENFVATLKESQVWTEVHHDIGSSFAAPKADQYSSHFQWKCARNSARLGIPTLFHCPGTFYAHHGDFTTTRLSKWQIKASHSNYSDHS